ncbi:MAG: NUDIX domain-containing protein [Candidatus Aenigmarchaeota archaeon]|nr:NUDIX domain-containing protein [Candidatus Aenigmarchaeota archaeon]
MREEGTDKLEVHVAGICFLGDSVLIAKRSASRAIFPGFWECGGGQVKSGESFEGAIKRQIREEFGAVIKPLFALAAYEIPALGEKQVKIPGVRFACQVESFLNGRGPEISEEHTEWKIQKATELDGLKFIPGLKQDIARAHLRIKELTV